MNLQHEGAPNYFPNSFSGPQECPHADLSGYHVTGQVARYNTADDDNFSQVTNFWNKVLGPEERKRLAQNIAGNLKNAAPFIQERALKNFSRVHPDFARMIRERIGHSGNNRSSL